MPRPKKNTTAITTRLDAEELELLQQWQASLGVNTQEMIKRSVHLFMDIAQADEETLAAYELPDHLIGLRAILHSPRHLRVKTD